MNTSSPPSRSQGAVAPTRSVLGRVTARLRYPSRRAASASLAAMAVLVTSLALLFDPTRVEHQLLAVKRWIELPIANATFDAIGSLTGIYVIALLWVGLLVIASLRRKWGTLVALAMVPLVGLTAVFIDRVLVTRAGPDSGLLERGFGQPEISSFPSSQVLGAVLIYGFVFVLARDFPSQSVRIVLQTASVLLGVTAGLAQLWAGTQWPSDILAGYVFGGLALVALLTLAQRVDLACGGIPFIRAAEVEHDENQPHAHALTSTVIFNGPTVSKIYAPGFLPRVIYWLAFQAEFPYMRNRAALEAAVLRRNLAGLLTEYWFGWNVVANALGIDECEGHFAITSEFIPGGPPADRQDSRRFLYDLADRFDDAGLPTWQVDPRQPRALDNLIQTEDGRYHIIDLESGLVSPLASPRTWWRALRRGLVPLYDDVFFDLTRSYIERHEASMRSERGDAWVQQLYSALDATEAQTSEWQDGEPRIWSRLLGRRRRPRRAETGRQNRAVQWFQSAIRSWQDDGRLSSAEADQLNRELGNPQFLAVLPHFGVHLVIGVILRFPVGSIVRTSYTTLNLLRIFWRFVTRRIDRSEWRQGVGIHSPLVILLAAMPGIGTFSYLASRPIRSNHLLVRVGLDAVLLKSPWHLYERLGLRWLIARVPYIKAENSGQSNRNQRAVTIFAGPQTIIQAMVLVLIVLVAAGFGVLLIDAIASPQILSWEQVSRIFNIGREQSVANWYSEFALLLCTALLALIGYAKYQARDRFARHWIGLAILSLGFSIDEQANLHNLQGGEWLRHLLGVDGFFFYGWSIPALIAVAVVGVLYRNFLGALPVITRKLFLIGATLFVVGEAGFELVKAYLISASRDEGLLFDTTLTFGEAMSMIGIVVVIAALLLYMRDSLGEVRVMVDERYVIENHQELEQPNRLDGTSSPPFSPNELYGRTMTTARAVCTARFHARAPMVWRQRSRGKVRVDPHTVVTEREKPDPETGETFK